jgi:hypothetical protein
MDPPQSPYVGVSTATTGLPRSGPSGAVDTIVVASAASGITPAALAAAIATLHAAAASREHVVGAVTAVGTPAGTAAGATTALPHPSVDPPSVASGMRPHWPRRGRR